MRFTIDIAISVAVEDKHVAEQIAAELKKRKVRYYYYEENAAESWGTYIIHLTADAYGRNSRYVLMITSAVYVKKYWSSIERQIAMSTVRPGTPHILQLRLDDTPVGGLSEFVVYREWNNNPEEIAELLWQKVKIAKDNENRRWTRSYMIGLIILLFVGLIYFFSIPIPPSEIQLMIKKIPVYSPTDTFYISETEVTIGQYRAYCKEEGIALPPQLPSVLEDSPVVNISWEEALAFCKWKGGRLPSEEEWQYAAGAGLAVKYSGGNNAARVAVYNRKKPAPVMSRQENMFKLYDMTGNVAEWCNDWFDSSATTKAVRGGSYNNTTVNGLAIAHREKEVPGKRRPDIGFRVAWDKE